MSRPLSTSPTPPGLRKRPRPASRFCDLGWLVDAESAGVIYGPPRQLSRRDDSSTKAPDPHPKGINVCPAVLEIEAKTFEIPCPFDISLKLVKNDKGRPALASTAGPKANISKKQLSRMLFLLQPERWRNPRRPVVQIVTPYRIVTDEPAWINQLPPYDHYFNPPWPGLLIGGRFPADIWPRSLMFAFEWVDTSKELVLRRGDPWFYLRFDTYDPLRPVRMNRAEMTPELRQYCKDIDAVTNYTNQTWKLFAEARSRRPEKLLKIVK